MTEPMTDELSYWEKVRYRIAESSPDYGNAVAQMLKEIRRLRQEVKDLSRAQFLAEERKKEIHRLREQLIEHSDFLHQALTKKPEGAADE